MTATTQSLRVTIDRRPADGHAELIVTLSGSASFTIVEQVDENGKVRFIPERGKPKDDERDAVSSAVVALARHAFSEAWEELYPTERRVSKRQLAAELAAENEELRRKIQELEQLLNG